MAHRKSESMSPPRLQEQRAESRSPPRLSVLRAQSKSPKRMGLFRTQSRSPPRLREQRAESKSPPRLAEGRTQSKSPPRLREQRAESKFPPRLAEGRTQSTSPPRSRGYHHPRDSRDPQSTGSEGTHNSGRTRRKHRRATPTPTPTPSQRRAPAKFDLHAACWVGNMAEVKRILSQGQWDINSEGGLWKRTPVMDAAWEGHVDVVKTLVGEGAYVSMADGVSNNLLHWACSGGDVETVKFVLSLPGVDINGRGEYSMPPVMWAAVWGHRDLVEFLVSHGADVSLVDGDGNNLLHISCYGGYVETVEFVLSLPGVDINAWNDYRLTAADVARDREHQEVVKLLVSRGTQ